MSETNTDWKMQAITLKMLVRESVGYVRDALYGEEDRDPDVSFDWEAWLFNREDYLERAEAYLWKLDK